MNKEEMEQAITDLQKQLGLLAGEVGELKQNSGTRQRGPKTERAMTEADAYRVKFGDLKDLNHKVTAEKLGLSYGQVFSCRGSYTFKQVRADWKPKDGAKPVEGAQDGT